jgi:DNA-binding MarR family transcriptional regulator
MGRWDLDDARSPGGGDWTPGAYVYDRPITREPDPPEIRSLPDRVTSRDRDDRGDDAGVRHHHLALPSGPDREEVRDDDRAYRLRGSEVDLLESVGRFRSVFVEDVRAASGDGARCDADLRSLERQGLIESKTITRVRHSETADVITVTPAGRELLEHHRDLDHDEQQYYGGWVKPSEVWHDASLFRMCHEVESELEREGSHVARVVLEDELKGEVFRSLDEGRRQGRSDEEVRSEIAERLQLKLDEGRFVFPDVRLEVEDRDGTERHVDLELVTEHYRAAGIASKGAAGFRMFRARSGSSGTPRDEDRMRRFLR